MVGFKLKAVLTVVVPRPYTFNVFTRRDGGRRSDNSHQFAVTTDLDPQHLEAAFRAVESYPLN